MTTTTQTASIDEIYNEYWFDEWTVDEEEPVDVEEEIEEDDSWLDEIFGE